MEVGTIVVDDTEGAAVGLSETIKSNEVLAYTHESGITESATIEEMGKCAVLGAVPPEMRAILARGYIEGRRIQSEKELADEEKSKSESDIDSENEDIQIDGRGNENNEQAPVSKISDVQHVKNSSDVSVEAPKTMATETPSVNSTSSDSASSQNNAVAERVGAQSQTELVAQASLEAVIVKASVPANSNVSQHIKTKQSVASLGEIKLSNPISEFKPAIAKEKELTEKPPLTATRKETNDAVLSENVETLTPTMRVEAEPPEAFNSSDFSINNSAGSEQVLEVQDKSLSNEATLTISAEQLEIEDELVTAPTETELLQNESLELPIDVATLYDDEIAAEDNSSMITAELPLLDSEDKSFNTEFIAELPSPVEEVEQSIRLIADKIENLEAVEIEGVNLILDEIKGVLAETQNPIEQTIEKNNTFAEIVNADDNLEVLFIKLFSIVGVDYTPDIIDSCRQLALQGDLRQLLNDTDLENEDTTKDKGTHEIINRILAAITNLKKSIKYACLIGKSTLQLYARNLALDIIIHADYGAFTAR